MAHQRYSGSRVQDILRRIPSHGWTAGWVGRRDRALVVLSQMAELAYEELAELAVGDVTVTDGVATIRSSARTRMLQSVSDNLQCGPCALARWVHALDLKVIYPDGRVVAAVIARAVPLTAESPHLCQSNTAMAEVAHITRRGPLLPAGDRWGSIGSTDPAAGHAESLQDRVEQLLVGNAV
ncbi:hypothetical protein ACVBEQ_09680 [Nakamurella sp. GG22]